MECRICFGDDHPETMMIPCRCRGTSAYVHDRCLRTYFHYYPDRTCRVCHESMRHPWVDTERNFICATILLVWGGILLTLSTVPFIIKCLTFGTLLGLLTYHVQRKHLTYETTFLFLAASFCLFFADPTFLPQTVFLVFVLLVLATLCLFVPAETVFLVLVVSLALTYSVLLTFAVAVRTDPAFTGLFLLAMSVFWFVFLRPDRGNALYD